MTKQKRRIVLFIVASLTILGLVFVSTGTVSARRGSPNCWGEKKDAKSGQEYRDYIKKIRGTDHYEFIPCPGCGKSSSSSKKSGGGGGGGGGGTYHPPVCSPRYHAPTVSLSTYTPEYPLVIGQDPDELGVDVTLRAQGGSKSNGCNRGAAQATITSFSLFRRPAWHEIAELALFHYFCAPKNGIQKRFWL